MAKICFLVGSLAISGGTYVIFQHATHLQRSGHEVVLAAIEPFDEATVYWHDGAKELNLRHIDQVRGKSYDLVIATWWRTALDILSVHAPRYAYFVQSIESRFYPCDEVPLRKLVDATYDLPINYVTEASWIVDHLQEKHDQSVFLARNGIRKDWYSENGPAHTQKQLDGEPRVLVEGHFGVPFKNLALSLKAARKAGSRDIWMLTGSPVSRVPGVKRVFSRVPAWKTAPIYRSCDILVKLSTVEGMFGPPLEHFHCGGTCVVYDVTGHDEYISNHVNGLVLPTGNIGAVVTSIRRLRQDRDLLEHLRMGARKTAESWPDWHTASAVYADWIHAVLDGPVSDTTAISNIITQASIVYEQEEKRRLSENLDIERSRRKEARWHKMPQRLQDYRRAYNFKKEVLFQDWTTR